MVFPSNSSVFPVFSQQKWLKCSFFPNSQYFSKISHKTPQKFFEKAPYRATFWEKWRICSLFTGKISEFFGIFQNNYTQFVTFLQQLVTFMQQLTVPCPVTRVPSSLFFVASLLCRFYLTKVSSFTEHETCVSCITDMQTKQY